MNKFHRTILITDEKLGVYEHAEQWQQQQHFEDVLHASMGNKDILFVMTTFFLAHNNGWWKNSVI